MATPNAAQSLTTAPELVIPTPNGGGICDTRCSEKGSALPRGKYVRVRSFLVERLSVGRVQTQHAAVAKRFLRRVRRRNDKMGEVLK